MVMSKSNQLLIREAVKSAGDDLKGKLPPHPHLKKRNSYAHIWERIKSKMGKSYKECDNTQAQEILDLIEYYAKNPC